MVGIAVRVAVQSRKDGKVRTNKPWKAVLCLTLVGLVGAFAGCATGAKGPTDEELITGVLQQWSAALIAKDVEKLMVNYSENFADREGRNKAAAKQFIQEAINNGYLDGLQVDTTTTQIVVNGVDATATPINLSSSAGSISLGLTLKKEDGAWRIIGSGEA